MKKSSRSKPSPRRLMNHYASWKYAVLIVTVIVLTLSALPTWFGELPSIQISASAHRPNELSSVATIDRYLKRHHIDADKITQSGEQFTLVFRDEDTQTQARKVLNELLGESNSISFSYVSVAPSWLNQLGFNPIKLGLDLRGGVQFLLNVDVDKAFAEQRDALADELRTRAREEHWPPLTVQSLDKNQLMVSSQDTQTLTQLTSLIHNQYPDWQIQKTHAQWVISPIDKAKNDFQTQTIAQNLKIMRGRIEELGITEALVQRQGEHGIRIELPGVQDPSEAKNVIGATASLAFYAVKEPAKARTTDSMVLQDNDGKDVVIDKHPVITGEHIVNARAGVDKMGFSEVNISLDHAGGKRMSEFSAKHIGQAMATVYREYTRDAKGETQRSERVLSVATIQSQLASQFRITGAGSIDEAQQLALLLRAGSLTAPVTIVEERTIGASLGAENIHNGFAALALGLGLTLTFMALWYRRLGWVANAALIINMVCLLGLIGLLPGAVLTLPGIAGLVLTVGMAVDTNVLIFERIKDKMHEGRSFAQAIDAGFQSAFSTILDANITTMITAVILFSVGNGPIQGFALTLGLGLLTSMFSGVFASRAIINLIWGRDSRHQVRV